MSNKTFIIAELSGNHNKNLQYIKDSIYAIKESGADAVKLQTYTPDSLTLNVNNEIFGPRKTGLWKGMTPYDVFSHGALPYEWHADIFKYAQELDLICFSTAFDDEGVSLLESVNCPIYKIASFEISHIPLIDTIAKTGKPIIMSTGIATPDDINQALSRCKNNKVTLLKCTSAYPTPYNEVNLNSIKTLRSIFNVDVGISDHTIGNTIPIAAVALGASTIEKHFILDKSKGGIDSAFSIEPSEFKFMVDSIRIVENALGSSDLSLTASAKESRSRGRSIYISSDVKKNQKITSANIKAVRAPGGIHPSSYHTLLNSSLTFSDNAEAGTALTFELINEKINL